MKLTMSTISNFLSECVVYQISHQGRQMTWIHGQQLVAPWPNKGMFISRPSAQHVAQPLGSSHYIYNIYIYITFYIYIYILT